ncbi:hypothetical protein [Pedobacter sp. SYSU D00535]|uniref:hypothetical protein n=1 Tax=Pedobacter sp. SYSU D00535 TaxID=2810308 RepID=UPI001A975CBE|nr:hypothetical protein [Pedobacter sp. SYSU D00535]
MKKINTAIALAFLNVMAFAQEKVNADVNLDINKGAESGGSFPWIWLVGALVLIILLFALLGGRRGNDRVIERDTIIRK